MNTYNVYEAKTNYSKLLDRVESGEELVLARGGRPIANVTPFRAKKNKIKFGTMAGMIKLNDKDLDGIDPEIQEMFYGKDWDK